MLHDCETLVQCYFNILRALAVEWNPVVAPKRVTPDSDKNIKAYTNHNNVYQQ